MLWEGRCSGAEDSCIPAGAVVHHIDQEAGLAVVHNLDCPGSGALRRAEPGGSHLERGMGSPVGEGIDLQADTGYLAVADSCPREDMGFLAAEDNPVEGIVLVPVGGIDPVEEDTVLVVEEGIGQEEGTVVEEVGRTGRDSPADRKDTTYAQGILSGNSRVWYDCRYQLGWAGLVTSGVR